MKTVDLDKKYIKEIQQVWNKHLQQSFPMRKKLLALNSFLDPNLCQEASKLIVNEEDKVIALVFAKRWRENYQVKVDRSQGFIQALLVDEAYRRKGLGSQLLAQVEASFKKRGIKKLSLGSDPWHYFPGLPAEKTELASWFEHQGYKQTGLVYDLINTYSPAENLPLPRAEGAHYEPLQLKDREQFLQFFKRSFPDRWLYEAIKYFEKGGSGREFVVLKKSGQIKGFCRLNDGKSPFIAQNVYWAPLFAEELGGIGPLGIDPEERGRGYGLGIVEAAISLLRRRGIQRIIIDWTDLNDFYGKLGYKKWKSYYTYSKTLK